MTMRERAKKEGRGYDGIHLFADERSEREGRVVVVRWGDDKTTTAAAATCIVYQDVCLPGDPYREHGMREKKEGKGERQRR